MKHTFGIAFLGLCLVVGGFVRAEAQSSGGGKVGFVDLQRTLNETKVGKAAQRRLNANKKKKQNELDRKRKQLEQSVADLKKRASVLKPELARKKEQEIQAQYVKLQETYMALQQKLVAQEAELVREIFAKAAPAIKVIAKEKGLTMVVDKTMVLWASGSLDITDAVNKRIK